MTRRGRCAVNIEPGEGATAGDALETLFSKRSEYAERAALDGAALAGVPRGMKSDALETRAIASEETFPFPRASFGVPTSSSFAADRDPKGAAGLSLTPNAANGSGFAAATGVAAGENAAIAASAAADAGPAPNGDVGAARTGPAPVVAAGPGGGHVAVVARDGGLGGTNDAEGSGNALSASRSSFWNSRTDSSADSTAKETRLEASDCLRFFLAASLSRPAPAGDLPSTLLTSLKMLLRLRLRMEEGVALATFSFASAAVGVVAGLEGVAAGEGSTFSACASAGGAPPLCRGERRRGSSEPAMAVRCVKAHPSDRDGINAPEAPPRCRAPRPARGGPRASRVYTRRVARLRVSHSRRRCVQPLARVVMRASRAVVTPGRLNRVVGRIDSCLSA